MHEARSVWRNFIKVFLNGLENYYPSVKKNSYPPLFTGRFFASQGELTDNLTSQWNPILSVESAAKTAVQAVLLLEELMVQKPFDSREKVVGAFSRILKKFYFISGNLGKVRG